MIWITSAFFHALSAPALPRAIIMPLDPWWLWPASCMLWQCLSSNRVPSLPVFGGLWYWFIGCLLECTCSIYVMDHLQGGWEFMDMRIFLTNSGSRISHLRCGQLDDVILYVLSLPPCFSSQAPNSRITSQINYLNFVLHLKLNSQGDKDKMVGTRTGWKKMLWDFGIGSLNSQTAVRICKQGHSDT